LFKSIISSLFSGANEFFCFFDGGSGKRAQEKQQPPLTRQRVERKEKEEGNKIQGERKRTKKRMPKVKRVETGNRSQGSEFFSLLADK
jgi:hypothetical protein